MAFGNATPLPGSAKSGRTRGGRVPQSQSPGVNQTRGLPANVPKSLGQLARGGSVVVNSTPTRKGR